MKKIQWGLGLAILVALVVAWLTLKKSLFKLCNMV